MSKDIVTQLREWHTTWNWYLPDEAADEIERLREMVDTFHKLAKHFYEQVARSE